MTEKYFDQTSMSKHLVSTHNSLIRKKIYLKNDFKTYLRAIYDHQMHL